MRMPSCVRSINFRGVKIALIFFQSLVLIGSVVLIIFLIVGLRPNESRKFTEKASKSLCTLILKKSAQIEDLY